MSAKRNTSSHDWKWYSNVQPPRTKKTTAAWTCACRDPKNGLPVVQPAYRVNCPDCFARRPGS